MKLVLTGWFIVQAAMHSPLEPNMYVLRDPKKNIDILVHSDRVYEENTWIQIQSIASCKRDWSTADSHWETFCIAESFEESECKPHNIFPVNGIIYC